MIFFCRCYFLLAFCCSLLTSDCEGVLSVVTNHLPAPLLLDLWPFLLADLRSILFLWRGLGGQFCCSLMTRILSSLQAQRPDELDIREGEELEVLEWDDGDGWCKGRSLGGKEGYFPQTYVQAISRPSSPVNLSLPMTAFSMGATPTLCNHQTSVTSVTSTITALSFSNSSPSHALALPNGTAGKWLC